MAHDWPGNVRELRNAADRFVLGMWQGFEVKGQPAAGGSGSLGERLDAFERSVIMAELARNGGAMKPTYEALGISRKGLYDKMRRLGLTAEDARDG